MHTRERLLTIVLVIAASLLTAPARGADGDAPADFEVARDGAVSLKASDDNVRGTMCLRLDVGESQHEGTCGNDRNGGVVLLASAGPRPGALPRYLAVATRLAATTIEIRRAGRVLLSAPTVSGESYRGTRAGTVSFALVRLPDGTREDGLRIRALDAGGALQAVLTSGDLLTNRTLLQSGRSGATRWRLVSRRSTSLSPSVLDPEREAVSRCIHVTTAVGGDRYSADGTCITATPFDTLVLPAAQVATHGTCAPRFRLVYGIVGSATTTVHVRLGSGLLVRAPASRVPSSEYVAYALAVAATDAVRYVRVSTTAGARDLKLGAAPLTVSCPQGMAAEGVIFGTSSKDYPTEPPAIPAAGPVTTVTGPVPFRIADGAGSTLCVAPGDQPFTGFGCGPVPLNLTVLPGVLDRLLAPRAFVAIVPANAATLRIAPEGGTARDLATVPGTGYAGPYAGRVRFVAGAITDIRELDNMTLLDAAGTVLHDGVYFDDAGFVEDPPPVTRRIFGQPGRPSIWESVVVAGASAADTLVCRTLTEGRPPAPKASCGSIDGAGSVSVLLRSSCASHRVIVAVIAPAGSRAIAHLTGGVASRIALRRGVGVLTVGPSRGVRSVSIVRDGKAQSLPLHAPAGARQCGWEY